MIGRPGLTYPSSCTLVLESCVFDGNAASVDGSVLYFSSSADVVVISSDLLLDYDGGVTQVE